MSWFAKLLGGSGGGTDASELLARDADLIDVRTPAEFAGGHARGFRNVPLAAIGARTPELKEAGRPVVVCCRSGGRSAQAERMLREAGVEVANAGSWQAAQRLVDAAGRG